MGLAVFLMWWGLWTFADTVFASQSLKISLIALACGMLLYISECLHTTVSVCVINRISNNVRLWLQRI